MSDERFVCIDIGYGDEWYITDNGERLSEMEIVDLLNKQQDTIITLKRRLEKINNGYGFLTHRNGLTANEWVIESQERELKKKDEKIKVLQNSCEIMNQRLSEKNKCDYKKAIIEFCKFMHTDTPLVEVMVDEFLQEVFDA